MLAEVFFGVECVYDTEVPRETEAFSKFLGLFTQKFCEGVVADKMDYNGSNTNMLFRSCSVRSNTEERLQRFFIAARRGLGHFVIIDSLFARLLVNLVALFCFFGQILLGEEAGFITKTHAVGFNGTAVTMPDVGASMMNAKLNVGRQCAGTSRS